MSLIGQRFGGYQVQALLGKGGMGEVYRAHDPKLGRDVALKVLPSDVTADRDRLARFEREARTLASLNHPHIGAIYGFEDGATDDGRALRALVLELVEGETLAERIARAGRAVRRGPTEEPTRGGRGSSGGPPGGAGLPVPEALTIAGQIADALDAAHEKGIVHRDLKPANIQVTPAGVVKVLDFGLAKAGNSGPGTADPGLDHASQAPTVTQMGTRTGVILGTPAYMSPEQARGQAVDKRTDIWAFGCVLYEMLTGRAAFGGGTVTDTLAAVVEHDPNWNALPASTPPGTQRLLRRCLEKDPRRRLRDIGDARVELGALEGWERDLVAPAVATAPARSASKVPWLVAATSVVAGLAVGATAWLPARGGAPDETPPSYPRIARLTAGPAHEFGPAISPDGKWVAYVSNISGRTDVWVRFLAGGEAVNLTAAAGLDVTMSPGISGLEMSPDGTRIAVMAKLRGSPGAFSTWEIPAPLPGVPRKIMDDGFVGMRWSPDGRRIAFIRAGSSAGDALWVADADGGNRREIFAARDGIHIHWPTWSEDGFVYFIRTVTAVANLDQSELYRINPDGGMMEPVVATLRRAMHPVIVPGGRGMIYAANPTTAELNLWWRPAAGGTPFRLTTGVGEYAEPRVSADGRTLVATWYELRQSLLRVSTTPSQFGRVTPVTDGYGGDLDPSLSPSGEQLVFSSSRTGDRDLWSARSDGTGLRPLTSGGSLDDRPAVSPDGRQVAFVSDRDGRRGIWLIDIDGGTPRRLADVAPTGGLSWSAKGDSIMYAAGTGTWPSLWAVAVADGRPRRISTPGVVAEPVWSPTRDVIAYLEPTTTGPSVVSLAFVDVAGEPRYWKLPPPPGLGTGFNNGTLAWSPDGRRLAVVGQNTNLPASIWIAEPDAGTQFRKLVELPMGPRIRGVTWTREGDAIIIGQHDTTSDIVLLDQGP